MNEHEGMEGDEGGMPHTGVPMLLDIVSLLWESVLIFQHP